MTKTTLDVAKRIKTTLEVAKCGGLTPAHHAPRARKEKRRKKEEKKTRKKKHTWSEKEDT